MIPERMRAAVLTGPRRVEVQHVPTPQPGPTQVLLRIEGCGLCGSNLPPWEGRPWFEYPFAPGAPGHEGWGRVVAVGSEVNDVAVGDRVAALTYNAFAEYDVAEASATVALPPALDGVDVPGEPLACVMNVFRRSDIAAGQHVAILGIGFLGAVLTQLASRAGANVIAISRRGTALDTARAMGAKHVLELEAGDQVVAAVEELTQGALCDRVIEATGYQQPLELAAKLTRVRGRLIIAGFHQDGHRQVDMQLWNWRGIDVINAHERDPAIYIEGMRAAIESMAEGTLTIDPLLTHKVTLDRLDEVFDALEQRPRGFLKGQVAP